MIKQYPENTHTTVSCCHETGVINLSSLRNPISFSGLYVANQHNQYNESYQPGRKIQSFNDRWSPKIIGELNGQEVKIAKVKGTFVWHDHKDEDELFMIIKGRLKIEFRDKTVELNEGEILIVPKGVEHRPVAEEEVLLLLFEPAATKHTGEVKHELTVEQYEKI